MFSRLRLQLGKRELRNPFRCKRPDGMDLCRGPFGRCSDSLENEKYPRLPVLSGRHFKQIPVVLRLVPDDMPAEIEDGNVEQALVDEIEQVQHASGPAVAVDKRMDRLELIMHDRKPDQWVDLLDLVNVALPIGQFAPENVLSLRRCVDDLVGCIVYQRRSRVLRISRSTPLIVRQTSTAMAVETGRRFSISKPRYKAVR